MREPPNRENLLYNRPSSDDDEDDEGVSPFDDENEFPDMEDTIYRLSENDQVRFEFLSNHRFCLLNRASSREKNIWEFVSL